MMHPVIKFHMCVIVSISAAFFLTVKHNQVQLSDQAALLLFCYTGVTLVVAWLMKGHDDEQE